VLANKTYLSPSIRQVLAGEIVDEGANTLLKSTNLTSREREVLQLLAEGKSNKEIAAILNRSVKTVEMHRHNIMQKLDLHTVAGLTKYAIQEGMPTQAWAWHPKYKFLCH